MALQLIYNDKGSIPTAQVDLYTEQPNGTWRLDVEGQDDTTGLKKALEDERERAAFAKREARELKERYTGLDMEEYKTLKAEHDKAKSKTLLDAGQVEELVKDRLAVREAENKKQVASMRQRLEIEAIDNRLREAAIEAGVQKTAIADAIRRGREVYGLDDNLAVLPMKDGKILYGADPSQPLPPREFFEAEMKASSPHWAAASSGSGTPPNARGGSEGKYVMTRTQAQDFPAFKAMQEAASKDNQIVTLVD